MAVVREINEHLSRIDEDNSWTLNDDLLGSSNVKRHMSTSTKTTLQGSWVFDNETLLVIRTTIHGHPTTAGDAIMVVCLVTLDITMTEPLAIVLLTLIMISSMTSCRRDLVGS